MDVLLILWAGIIPLVPLVGAEKFKRKGDAKKRAACLVIFALQLLLSISYVVMYYS